MGEKLYYKKDKNKNITRQSATDMRHAIQQNREALVCHTLQRKTRANTSNCRLLASTGFCFRASLHSKLHQRELHFFVTNSQQCCFTLSVQLLATKSKLTPSRNGIPLRKSKAWYRLKTRNTRHRCMAKHKAPTKITEIWMPMNRILVYTSLIKNIFNWKFANNTVKSQYTKHLRQSFQFRTSFHAFSSENILAIWNIEMIIQEFIWTHSGIRENYCKSTNFHRDLV